MRISFSVGAAAAAALTTTTSAVHLDFNNAIGDALLGPVDTSSSLLAEAEVTSSTDMPSHDYASALAAKRSGFRQVDAKGGHQEFGVLAQLMADVLASDARKKGTVYNLAQRLTRGTDNLAQTRASASLFEMCCGSTQDPNDPAVVEKRLQAEANEFCRQLLEDGRRTPKSAMLRMDYAQIPKQRIVRALKANNPTNSTIQQWQLFADDILGQDDIDHPTEYGKHVAESPSPQPDISQYRDDGPRVSDRPHYVDQRTEAEKRSDRELGIDGNLDDEPDTPPQVVPQPQPSPKQQHWEVPQHLQQRGWVDQRSEAEKESDHKLGLD